MKRILVLVALTMAAADLAQAQIIQQVGRGRPRAWTSLAAGWLQHTTTCDVDSGACWNFGGAPQFRGSLEMPIGRDASVGFAATTARVPLVYATVTPVPGSCGNCDADANVSQFLANFRIGGSGLGFHQVIDLVAGTTMYSNFRSTDGARLGTGKAINDITVGLGYGLGYALSTRTQFMLVQEWALVLRDRQPGSADNTAQQRTVRVGIRVGLGDR